jgi:pantoate--beta-alanine ligase
MIVTQTISDCRAARASLGKVALVPTMGALHDGHIALIRHAKTLSEHVAVSIFVNPTQFGPKEDFTRYPRPLEADLAKCETAGATLVFNPSPTEMYGDTPRPVLIDFPHVTDTLEGKHRPGHFRGVCQVVAKLFNIIQPNAAVFGLKDFQQFAVLRAMVELLNFPIEVIGHPTIRDQDGLAMSSRNVFLSPPERRRALSISRALFTAKQQFDEGIKQTSRLVATMHHILLPPAATALTPDGDLGRVPVSIDYVAAVDARTLQAVDVVQQATLLAIAARVGATRLIDNVVIGESISPC